MSAAAAAANSSTSPIKSDIPARLDRLPWSRWHWMIVIGLGTVWILDGLEVTIVGSIASRLTEKGSGLALTDQQAIYSGMWYVAGACLGALFFGRMTDRFGRKKLFLITLAVYLLATVATAFTSSYLAFAICRFFTGAGIGGEYAAINSAIDELIPARVRGRVDLIINGSFWGGAVLGGGLAIVLLDESMFAADLGWRLAFGMGAILGVAIMLVRRLVPESPRWLMLHGRQEEAERIVTEVEERVRKEKGELPPVEGKEITINPRGSIGLMEVTRTVFSKYRQRALVGTSLFVGQAFLYNATLFTAAIILTEFYDVPSANAGYYIIPFALGNLFGPLVLGKFFDTVGRKPMIAGCYILSGFGLLVLGALFKADVLNATTHTIALCVIFFFASAGASAAYLTVSEVFPMETRAMAIAVFFAIGTAIGGISGPYLFAKLVEKETTMFWGFVGAGILMALAGIIQAIWGVKAERRSLEDLATPVLAEEAAGETPTFGGDDDDRRSGTGRFRRTAPPAATPRLTGRY